MSAFADADQYRGLRVLVLGASGFIGRWVAGMLPSLGAEPILAVRDRSGATSVFRDYGVSGSIEKVDLTDSGAVKSLLERITPSLTFNLAGYGVDQAERDQQVAGLLNAVLPEFLAAHLPVDTPGWRGRVLIHAGSGIEYGSAAGVIDESTTPLPVSTYARSKLAGTNAVREVGRGRAPGRFLTVRLFTVYGPGEHAGRLLPSLIDAAERKIPLSLTTGTQRRDFTYVRDVAEGLLRLAVAPESRDDVVNLATGQSTTVREFVRTAAAVLPLPEDLLRFGDLPTRPDEMKATRVDVSRMRSITGWLPGTGIDSGIIQTRDFYKRLASDAHNHIV